MRNGFTLVEVMAAVVIATIAGISLLQMSSQSTFLFTKVKESSYMSETLSIAGAHSSKRFDKSEPALYDLLSSSYDITNDRLRKLLKESRYSYNEKVVDTITFGGMFVDDEIDLSGSDTGSSQSAPIIQFELIDVSLGSDARSGSVLVARVF